MVAYYYVDNTNGNNARTGLRIPVGDYNSTSYNTIDSVPDTTHFIDSVLTGADNYISGSFCYNVTKSLGRLITGFDAGSDRVAFTTVQTWEAGDEYYIIDSYQTVLQATSTGTAQAAGNCIYVRANQTHTIGATVSFDEDGTIDAPISLIGCSTTFDPWHDESDTRVILNVNAGAYFFTLNTDDFWNLKNLDIKNNNITDYGLLNIRNSFGNLIQNCRISASAHGSGFGVNTEGFVGLTQFEDCTFENNDNYNVMLGTFSVSTAAATYSGVTKFYRCSFDGGAQNPDYGISTSGTVYLEDCTFGTNAAHGIADIYLGRSSTVYARNCRFTGVGGVIIAGSVNNAFDAVFYSENHDGVFGNHYVWKYTGTITRVVDPVRTGGATSSAYMVPSSLVSVRDPLSISTQTFIPDFKLWCAAGAQTITVYILSETTWGGTYPTAAQLWLSAEYVTSDVTDAITHATAVSTETLGATNIHDGVDETWLGLTCSINPHVASFVNLKVYLNNYVATNGIYVDVKPVIS